MENSIKNILITDRKYTGETDLVPRITAAIKWHNISAVQIREKDILNDEELIQLILKISAAVKEKKPLIKIIINSRYDLVNELDLDGVHLPESGLIPENMKKIRETIGHDKIIGVSTHSVQNAVLAEKSGADYVTFSPIFYTESKKDYGAPQGLTKLAECVSTVDIPVIALGGINEDNINDCLTAGASGVAAIKYFLSK